MTRMLVAAAAALSFVSPAGPPGAAVGIDMRNVHLRVAADAALDISWLHGTLTPTRPGQVPVFDDPSSFELRIEDAELSLDGGSLTALVNRAFEFKGSNLSGLRVSFDGPLLVQHGTLRKGVHV